MHDVGEGLGQDVGEGSWLGCRGGSRSGRCFPVVLWCFAARTVVTASVPCGAALIPCS